MKNKNNRKRSIQWNQILESIVFGVTKPVSYHGPMTFLKPS